MTGAHREAGDPSLELAPAAVHVDFATHALADPQIGELSFLEIAIDPDLGDRADGHQILADGDVVSGVDVAAGDHAVDLAHDVAVAEVQEGLIEVGVRLQQLGLGLLDRRGVGQDFFEDLVDVLICVALAKVLQEFLGCDGCGGHGQADLCHRLDQAIECCPHCGKGLIEILGDFGQVVPGGRLGGEAEIHPAGMHGLDRLLDARLVDLDRLAAHVEIFLADAAARFELHAALEVGLRQLELCLLAFVDRHVGAEVGDLVGHLLDGRFQRPALGCARRLQPAHPRLGRRQVGLGCRQGGPLDRHLNLERFLVEPDQEVALLDAVVVIHKDLAHLARDPRSDEGDVAVDVSVVSRHRVEHR